jgi:hypothetical protein
MHNAIRHQYNRIYQVILIMKQLNLFTKTMLWQQYYKHIKKLR